jgi:hypothetical protein
MYGKDAITRHVPWCRAGMVAVRFALAAILALLLGWHTAPARAHSGKHQPAHADDFAQMFTQGIPDATFRTLDFATRNVFFQPDVDPNTAAAGGILGFTSAALDGFSFRISGFGQVNYIGGSHKARDLGPDIATLGEAYVEWQGDGLKVRAGDQELTKVPFTQTWNYRVVPATFQGIKLTYGNQNHYLTAMRMVRFKSLIATGYHKTTNYNPPFNQPFMPGTNYDDFAAQNPTTPGFWAIGGGGKGKMGGKGLDGQLWYIKYLDYSQMWYADGKLTFREVPVKPFVAIQLARQINSGAALIGPIDAKVYGLQLGIQTSVLKLTLNDDYIPHHAGTYLNGGLATPYATQIASGPLFAQPYLTSTQDLGSGNAWSLEAKWTPAHGTTLGARYSRMNLKPVHDGPSRGQSEYLVYGTWKFRGALKGWSLTDYLGLQTQRHPFAVSQQPPQATRYWENRLTIQYQF